MQILIMIPKFLLIELDFSNRFLLKFKGDIYPLQIIVK